MVTGRPTGGFRFPAWKRQKLDGPRESRIQAWERGNGVGSVLRGRCRASTAGNDALYCKLPDCDAALSFQIAAVRLTFTRVRETITHRALWRSQQWDSNGARGVVGGAVGACKPAGSTVALFAVLRCPLSLAGVRYEVVGLLRPELYLPDAVLEHCAQEPNVNRTWWLRRPRATCRRREGERVVEGGCMPSLLT